MKETKKSIADRGRFLSVAEFALLCGESVEEIRRAAREGEIVMAPGNTRGDREEFIFTIAEFAAACHTSRQNIESQARRTGSPIRLNADGKIDIRWRGNLGYFQRKSQEWLDATEGVAV